jgi:hypothetical protein
LRSGGGKRQRFCCAAHRSRFWRALRKWASRVFDAGLIAIDDLRRPSTEFVVGPATGAATGDSLSHSNVHAAPDGEKQA